MARTVSGVLPAEATGAEAPASAAPFWAIASTGVLTLIGLALSSYLTYVHYSGNTKALYCAPGKFDCQKVVTSSYSVIFGIPVPVYGLAFFVSMLVLCSPWGWRSPSRSVMWARLAACLVGIGMITWLVYVEIYRLQTICPWCTSVHVVTFVTFVIVALATARMQSEEPT